MSIKLYAYVTSPETAKRFLQAVDDAERVTALYWHNQPPERSPASWFLVLEADVSLTAVDRGNLTAYAVNRLTETEKEIRIKAGEALASCHKIRNELLALGYEAPQ